MKGGRSSEEGRREKTTTTRRETRGKKKKMKPHTDRKGEKKGEEKPTMFLLRLQLLLRWVVPQLLLLLGPASGDADRRHTEQIVRRGRRRFSLRAARR